MATSSTSVSGLVSGLDTTTIISQLMQIEAQPQTNLKNQVSAEQQVVTALQGINAKMAGLATSAGTLGSAAGWNVTKATSTNTGVSVNASGDAAIGSVSFTVNAVATAAAATYTTSATSSAAVLTPSSTLTVSFADGRTPVSIATGDGSLSALTSALNASGTGLQAVLVRNGADSSGNPTYALAVASTTTGANSGFTINDSNGNQILGGATPVPGTGTDASITVTGQSSPIISSTNTITGLMPGVDVTLGAGATGPATVSVAKDATSISNSVKSMVDAVNSILNDIDTGTAYNASTKTAGVLSGDSTVRSLRDKILATVSSGVGGSSLASVGIQTDRNGRLVFDAAKFASAYAADPAGTQAKFIGTTSAPGLAASVATIATAASDSTSGTLTTAIQGHNSSIKDMNDRIADWDTRLADKQAALQKQYADLEVALGKLQDQSTWLAGQIGSLPTASSGK